MHVHAVMESGVVLESCRTLCSLSVLDTWPVYWHCDCYHGDGCGCKYYYSMALFNEEMWFNCQVYTSCIHVSLSCNVLVAI